MKQMHRQQQQQQQHQLSPRHASGGDGGGGAAGDAGVRSRQRIQIIIPYNSIKLTTCMIILQTMMTGGMITSAHDPMDFLATIGNLSLSYA